MTGVESGAERTVGGDWLQRHETQTVFAALLDAGHQAYAVGGSVRNALLGEPVGDIDIATDARPDQTEAAAEAAGLRAIPTGRDHGTITILSGGIPHEVTTFRRDIETDGRHAVVAFSTNMADDAARRDFTMNALYATRDGKVLDPLGGYVDLIARRVRFIGSAAERIQEDALRILRFFRFHAQYGDPDLGIDAEGLAASAEAIDMLDRLSAERIGQEMRKLLGVADPAPSVASMASTGALARVVPGGNPAGLAPLIAVEAGADPYWLRRLAALGGETDRLCLSRAETRHLDAIRAALEIAGDAEAGYRQGEAAARDAGLIRASVTGEPAAPIFSEVTRGAGAVFPVAAGDLMPPLDPGPALGAALKRLEAIWIGSDFQMTREDLIRRL